MSLVYQIVLAVTGLFCFSRTVTVRGEFKAVAYFTAALVCWVLWVFVHEGVFR